LIEAEQTPKKARYECPNVLLDSGDDHKDRFSMATERSGCRIPERLTSPEFARVRIEVNLRGRPIAENAVGSGRYGLPIERLAGSEVI
jgi:hypothetical protein